MIKATTVDALLDSVDDEENPASVLADLLDDVGEWDVVEDTDHDPCDRFAIVESSGAWWMVYRGSESDSAERFACEASAREAMADQSSYLL